MQRSSVVIPIKNGGSLLKSVIQSVLSQKTTKPFDLWLIDSGSKDDSLGWIKRLSQQDPRVHLHEIPPREFQHGKTRNLGVQLCQGDRIAFLTQDALPANETWLERLLRGFDLESRIAGVFGRHLPYSSCNSIVQRDLEFHFQSLDRFSRVHSCDNLTQYNSDLSYRQMVHFFSNNNSCIRRDIWHQFPFPEVDFAEDQAWAKTVIESGQATAYIHRAEVFHSHDFWIRETFKRSVDEGHAFKRMFGYVSIRTKKELIKKTLSQSLRDWKYLVQLTLTWKRALLLFQVPFLNLAKFMGQYVASRLETKTPLSPWISLDQKLKRL